MTQEDKDLLLRDLCARLPYGLICQITDTNDESFVRSGKLLEIKDLETDAQGTTFLFFNEHVPCYSDITEIKPYLRLMSSMTEEERNEYFDIKMQETERVALAEVYRPEAISIIMDWLNAHHFDYRNLIEKGLALEAPEDMYNIKENNYGNN